MHTRILVGVLKSPRAPARIWGDLGVTAIGYIVDKLTVGDL